jgi:tetraacyldisaccharide 4'-kinase
MIPKVFQYPLSKVVDGLTVFHQFLYDAAILDQIRIKPCVISVGNLTMGGTGKTPFVDFLLSELEQMNLKACVISRSYKALATNPVKVDWSRKDSAELYGDEATWLANRHPETPVVVSQQKYKAASYVDENIKAQVVIVDDGFQHRSLHRDLDIVLIDCTQGVEALKTVPWGQAREPISALERASLIVLTKCNWVEPQVIEQIKSVLPFKAKVCCMNYLSELDLQPAPRKLLLVSGIARPDNFEKSIQQFNFKVFYHLKFPDHYQYDQRAIASINQHAKAEAVTDIVTTEKDFTKLQNFTFTKPITTVRQSLQWHPEPPEFLYEYFRKLVV